MQWDTPKHNRTAVLKRFNGRVGIQPRLFDINGESEWIDNYIQFGDLVATCMGDDACEFYFEQLYDLLSLMETPDTEKTNTQEEVKKEEKRSGGKQGKGLRGNSKRLF
jgi:hypothetical protein